MEQNQLKEILHMSHKVVHVFSTNIADSETASKVAKELEQLTGVFLATMDLEDWEKILRVECDPTVAVYTIELVVRQMGYTCGELV